MSKESLLELEFFNLFKNNDDRIQYSLSKEEKVRADYSSYDKLKFDVKGINATSQGTGDYIRLTIATISGEKREYHNGVLFVAQKDHDAQPDYFGTVSLDKERGGPTLRLAAWKKVGEKAGDFLSVAISEHMAKQQGESDASSSTQKSNQHQSPDLDDVPF